MRACISKRPACNETVSLLIWMTVACALMEGTNTLSPIFGSQSPDEKFFLFSSVASLFL